MIILIRPMQTPMTPVAYPLDSEDRLLLGKRGERPDWAETKYKSPPRKKRKTPAQVLSHDQIKEIAQTAVDNNDFYEMVVDFLPPKIVWIRDREFYDSEHDIYVESSAEDRQKIKSRAEEIFNDPENKKRREENQKRFQAEYEDFWMKQRRDNRLTKEQQKVIERVRKEVRRGQFNNPQLAFEILYYAYDIGLFNKNQIQNWAINLGLTGKYDLTVKQFIGTASRLKQIINKKLEQSIAIEGLVALEFKK